MKFFSKWYLALPPVLKSSLKELIKKEQFSFANGGWCMHDEAATHYMGMIDQTTLGHQFLLKELGVVPKVGWQIDPFGHSATQGGLLTAQIHYVDLQNRQAAAECEGLWKSAPDNSSVFWGLTGSYSGNYGAPDGFCFDALCADDPLVGLEKDALKRESGSLQMHWAASDNGEIKLWSDRFDKVNIFYSTPERYTHCKYADLVNAKTSGEGSARTNTIQRDWFPYADCDHCYWTGYFTSRQGLKRMERVGSSFLHAARQIESMQAYLPKDQRIRITTDAWNASPLYELDDAMGVVQHHDGVSGTSKQHVAYDYAKRIAGGMNKANSFVTDALRKLLLNSNEGVLDNLTYCLLNNETICTVSQEASREGSKEDIYVIVYNALAKERHEVVSLPIDSSSYDFVEKLGGEQSDWNDMGDEIVMSNDILSVTFDQSTGVITSITNLRDGITVNVEQQYGFYKSAFKDAPMNFGLQRTGKTQERTSSDLQLIKRGWIKQIARLLPGKDFVEIEYIVGPVPIDDGGKEVVSKWTTSIASDGQFFTDSNGREFQKRKRGDHNVFGPDQPNSDEPVSGNYYPVNSIFIEDTVHSFGCVVDRSQGGASLTDGTLELMIQRRTLYDDARGVGEPLNETDIGITPNPPYDNAERLGEGVIVKGHHRMIVGKGGSGASKMRGIMDSVFSQPHVFVASAPSGTAIPFKQATLSMLQTSLPDNIMVISFVALGEENTYLIRLGHQYGPNEDTSLSRQVEIDLHKLFVNKKLTSVQEKTLSGNQMRADWEARRFQWDCTKGDYLLSRDNLRDGHVVLKPLEIRTYEIVLS
ncbi:lysosomal alpha-mannosidase [Skeletonema marinoi]|uniref:Alpha-mannosidase n=1 Tax=Skeletonema marinoi TaxID=267567 RepID=A0AAD8YHN1_9STRA|nr:lysosomal alpha-mannosidase [Skeletonema marinoi]